VHTSTVPIRDGSVPSMRLSLILVVAAACGGPSKPPPAVPLPNDKPAAPPPSAAAEPKESEGTKPEAAPPRPTGPIEIKIAAAQTTVKVVSDGKGKKQPLRYTTRAGAKQAVEIAMDFSGKQDTDESVVPTIVLSGEAETRSVDKDGSAEYTLTITGTDARPVASSSVPIDKFKDLLGSLSGLTIGGKRGANGAAGDVTMRIEHPPEHGPDALELIRFTFPAFPVLPTQAVGVGAKWQSTTTSKLADKLDVTQVTSYELVAHQGSTWTIKGTSVISGKDQEVDTAKISAISGQGTSETTIADGALYPTHKASSETSFKASDASDKSSQFVLKLGSAFTPR
jgi:hypothetical protein